MSYNASIHFAFAIDLGKNIPLCLYLTDNPTEEYQQNQGNLETFFTLWKASKGSQFDFPFELVSYFYPEDFSYLLAYCPTIQINYSDDPFFVNLMNIDSIAVKKMLTDNGFEENINPRWIAVNSYV